ncbi:hypothetical protein [Acinetobacter sp. YH12255]|uniref:hypothetical protein n=1 Tax=Acinetobacter sp. YH12255 TaxID=2601179 RepID=UPI0015D3E3C0|nr:hypothetical protein [Acinetobacter sp. YH12255]
MNLIERLGGYEKAKRELQLKEQNSILQCCASVTTSMIRSAMLEYRREHKMYEVGDKYVMLKLWHDDLMTVEDGEMDGPWWNERIIRHATDVEIEAGKRLEVSQ